MKSLCVKPKSSSHPVVLFSAFLKKYNNPEKFDDKKTVASILKKLTDTGFGDFRIGQSGAEIAKMFNLKEFSGWLDLGVREKGINWLYADVSIGLIPPNADVCVIKLNIDTSYLPIDDARERISKAIAEYLENVMKMEKIDKLEKCVKP